MTIVARILGACEREQAGHFYKTRNEIFKKRNLQNLTTLFTLLRKLHFLLHVVVHHVTTIQNLFHNFMFQNILFTQQKRVTDNSVIMSFVIEKVQK